MIRTGLGLRRRYAAAKQRIAARLDRPRWLHPPDGRLGPRLCILATWCADDTIGAHATAWAAAWRAHGFKVVLVAASDRPREMAPPDRAAFDGVLVRRNHGYDFGSWRAALGRLRDATDVTLLALANDSVYGPLDGFGAMLARVDASSADFVGLTDSHQRGHHLQSYLTFYRPAAMASDAFRRFWRRAGVGGREQVIEQAELRLLDAMHRGGVRSEVLYPADPTSDCNPTLVLWRELLDRGYPLVKVQLMRDNPFDADLHDWPDVLRAHGFDPLRVVAHLGALYDTSAAAAALLTATGRARPDG